jgi:site-specific DNA-methyltransferase (adenine-specific)
MIEKNTIIQGDCLEVMKNIEDGSVDMILCDLPYGTTACSWDEIIPLDDLWKEYMRVIRNNGFIVLFGSQPFSTKLINSNIEKYSHQWIWEKEQGTNPLLANIMPLKNFEDVIVFYNEYKKYDYKLDNPLRKYFNNILFRLGKTTKDIEKDLGHRRAEHTFYVQPKIQEGEIKYGSTQFGLCTKKTYDEILEYYGIKQKYLIRPYSELVDFNNKFEETLPDFKRVYNPQMIPCLEGVKSCGGNNTETIGVDLIGDKKTRYERFPTSIIKFQRDKSGLHPTQKPVALMEYLIKTYTNEGDLILDNCMGSGTTGVACINTGREFIGIEKDEEYCKIANKRIEEAKEQKTLW